MINMLILSLTAASVCCLVTGVLGFHLSNGAVLSSRPAIVTSSSLSLSLTASAGLASQSTVLSRLALAPVNARAHVPYITPRPHIISLSSSSSSLWAKAPTQSPSSPTQQKQQQQSAVLAPAVGKLGVLFLNLGGPERLEDVEPFLYNLFADPDIIRLPPGVNVIQKLVALYISKTRSGQSRENYASIGGGSPIVKYTSEQSRLVEEALRARGYGSAKAYFAMRYWHPMTDEVLRRIEADGVDNLVIVPLYPHFSLSTSGSSLKLLNTAFEQNPKVWLSGKIRHTVAPTWYHRPGYVKAMAQLVVNEVAKLSKQQQAEGVDVLFSAHGVPQSYIGVGDLYQSHIEESMLMISREVAAILSDKTRCPATIDASMKNAIRFHLSFQSRVGPVPWLRPYTDDKIREMGKQKVRNLAVVPIAFVSEHIETLEEIDGEYRELAHESGVHNWIRVPALNTEPAFIEDMADIVEEALVAPAMPVSDAAFLRTSKAAEAAALSETRFREATSCRSVRGRVSAVVTSAVSSATEAVKGLLRL